MELTKNELAVADRYLLKREKQLAQWPNMRWLILAIFSASMLIGYRNINDAMRSIHDDQATDLQVRSAVDEETPPPGLEHLWIKGAMMKIEKVLELRHQVVTYAMMQVALGYIQLLSGAVIVGLIILRWKTSARDTLICKLLRGKLQELEQAASANSRPPPQSPASPEIRSSDSQRMTSSGGVV